MNLQNSALENFVNSADLCRHLKKREIGGRKKASLDFSFWHWLEQRRKNA